MEQKILERILYNLENGDLPEKSILLIIIEETQRLLENEPNVVHVNTETYVVGDLHGQYYDFLNMLKIASKEYNIVFMGDYVDRGYNSVELIIHIFLLKLLRPEQVVLLRGNHENRGQTSAYGFMEECVYKYDMYIYWCICDLFMYMPMSAIINDKYLCIHGGIVPGLTMRKLIDADRIVEYSEVGSVLWSDPSDEIDLYKKSERGAGSLFGQAALREFLESEGLEYLVRSHQLVMDGAKKQFGGRCITIWSAPNYCYKCKNMASIMEITKETYKIIFYEAIKIQYK